MKFKTLVIFIAGTAFSIERYTVLPAVRHGRPHGTSFRD